MSHHESFLANFRPARFGRFALALILGFGLCGVARAGDDRWTPYGPGEGLLQSLVASTRGDLYVTSTFGLGEVWQRPAASALWRWRGAGLGLPSPPGVTALAVHPKNPSALWAVATEGITVAQSVFRSNDAGASWRKLYTGDVDFQIVRLTVAPTARSVVLLAETGRGAPKRLWRSSDLGTSWTEVPETVGPVAAAPDEPGTVYAVAASGSKLVKSVDGGATFHPTGALPIEEGDEVRALHATYGRPALVLASFRAGGLYRSTNGGGTWRRAGFLRVGPSAVASEPGNPKKIYAVNFGGLYASDLGGQSGSFRTLTTSAPGGFQPEPVALVAAPGGPYFLVGSDLYRFASPESYALVALSGIEAFGVAELRIAPHDPSFVALRGYTGCIRDSCDFRTLLSTDGGATFTRLRAQVSPRRFLDVTDLAFDPADPHRWLLTVSGFLQLHEAGDSYLLGRPLGTVYPVGAVEFAADGTLLVVGLAGVLRSEDLATPWVNTLDTVVPPSPEHPAGGTREIVDLVADPYAREKVIARALEFTSGLPRDPGSPVLYRSTDAGLTWTKLRDGGGDVEFIPGTSAGFYLLFGTAVGSEFRRSDDFGATSTLIHTFPLADGAGDVAADPSGSGDLYVATRFGVRRSRDGGVTWVATPGGFTPFGPSRRWIGTVQVAPDGRLIAAPLGGGLFENRLSN